MRKILPILLIGLPLFAFAFFGTANGGFFGSVASAGYGGADKVTVCHKPDSGKGHTLTVGAPALDAHLGHGDTPGACPQE